MNTFRSTRRDFLRIGGLGLCGVGMLDLLQAQARPDTAAKAKHMIVCWLGGGPPHLDMFDMKPDAPQEYRGEFKPIPTKVAGLQVCELMPELAKRADKYTIIRSVTHDEQARRPQPGAALLADRQPAAAQRHGRVSDVRQRRVEAPARPRRPADVRHARQDRCSHAQRARAQLPRPGLRPFIFDPLKSKDAITQMLTPQMEVPAFERNADLLKIARHEPAPHGRPGSADRRARPVSADGVQPAPLAETAAGARSVAGSRPSRSSATRRNTTKTRYPAGDPLHFLLARRLVEAGVPIVHFNLGYWDWHGENFTAGRQQIPMFDAGLSALLDDLEDAACWIRRSCWPWARWAASRRSTIPRRPGPDAITGTTPSSCSRPAAASSGATIVGATDKLGEHVTDKFYKVESFGRTLYHLLGIDPDTLRANSRESARQADRRGRSDHQGGDRLSICTKCCKRLSKVSAPLSRLRHLSQTLTSLIPSDTRRWGSGPGYRCTGSSPTKGFSHCHRQCPPGPRRYEHSSPDRYIHPSCTYSD